MALGERWGVVLAAGASRRMGRHKLLLEVAGEPMVRRAARALLACDLTGVLVVLGREPQAIRAALDGLGCAFVENPQFERGGLPSSIALALGSLPTSAEAALLTLADMPLVGEAHLRRVLAVDGTQAALSRYGQVTAPPHQLPRALFGAVQRASAAGLEKPLPTVLGNSAVWVAQPPADLLDVDDEASYRAALARVASLPPTAN